MARKIFSSCLAIIFVPAALITIFLFNIKGSFLNPEFYKKNLRGTAFYQALIEKGLPSFIAETKDQNNPVLQVFTKDEMAEILKGSITTSWLQNQVEKFLDAYYNYVSGKKTDFVLIVDLTDVKNKLTAKIDEVLQNKWNRLIICTKGTTPYADEKTELPVMPKCRLSGQMWPDVKNQMLGNENSLEKTIPDQLDIGASLRKNPRTLTLSRDYFGYFHTLLWSMLALTIVLFLIILFLNLAYPPGMLKWLSIPVLIVAIIGLMSALFNYSLMYAFLSATLPKSSPEGIQASLAVLVKSFNLNLLIKMLIEYGILFVVSLIGLIMASSWSKKSPPPKGSEKPVEKK